MDLIGDLLCGQPEGALEQENGGRWLEILTHSIQSQVWYVHPAWDSTIIGESKPQTGYKP